MGEVVIEKNTIEKPFDPLGVPEGDPNLKKYLKTNIRNDVREIIRSYHQTYDHLQELLQNAIDVCEDTFKLYKDGKLKGSFQPQIEISFDLIKNSVTVCDNGTGMSNDHLMKYYFMPHATLKDTYSVSSNRIRGEKGVGATFLSFGSSWINVSTKNVDGIISSCKLSDGIKWVLNRELEDQPVAMPLSPPKRLFEMPHGTIITVGFDNDTNISDLKRHGPDVDHWEIILRIYSAVGWILPFGRRDEFFDALTISVEVINEEGTNSKIISGGFLYPHQIASVTSKRLSDLNRGSQGKLAPSDINKDCIWDFHTSSEIEEKIRAKFGDNTSVLEIFEKYQPSAYVAFVWSRDFWDEINRKCFKTSRKEFEFGYAFSTKSQRIGELREISFKWYSGDYNRFFILYSVENLHADIGRKSVPKELRQLADEISNILHDDYYRPYSDALKSEPSMPSETDALKLEELTDQVLRYTDLDEEEEINLNVIKIPQEEQDVIALFFNLLGKEYLKGYKILSTKASAKYDAFTQFYLKKEDDIIYHPANNPLGIPSNKFGKDDIKRSPDRSLMEFKYSSDGLINDVIHEKKKLYDIRWLVCWEIGSKHKRQGMQIIDITEEEQQHYREYYGVTHLLTDGPANVYVICLKDVISILKKILK